MELPKGVRNLLLTLIVLAVGLTVIGLLSRDDQPTSTSAVFGDSTWYIEFLDAYEDRHGDVDAATALWLQSNAEQMCHYLDGTPDLAKAWMEGVDSGMSGDQAATTIEGAIRFHCPRHLNLLTAGM